MVACLPIRQGVWKKNFDQQKKGLCVAGGSLVRSRLGLGHLRWARSLAWASARRLLTYACGFWIVRYWVGSSNGKYMSRNMASALLPIGIATRVFSRFFTGIHPQLRRISRKYSKKITYFIKKVGNLAKKAHFFTILLDI